jgi:hypothetical protein
MLGAFLHICTCTYTIYCGLWPPGNTGCIILTWYQSPGSWVRVLVFAIYCKIAVAPLCIHLLTFFSLVCVHVLTFSSPICVHVLTFSSLVTREWGCWSVYVDCTSPFHQFGLLVALASAWSLTKTKMLFWWKPSLSYSDHWTIKTGHLWTRFAHKRHKKSLSRKLSLMVCRSENYFYQKKIP